MKATLLTVALLVCAGSTAMAQKGYRWEKHDQVWHRANPGHHYDRYRGSDYDRYRDMHRDERAIEHDKWEIRDDIRRGDYAAARREREEMRERERERDLHRDRNARFGWGHNQRWDAARFANFGWR